MRRVAFAVLLILVLVGLTSTAALAGTKKGDMEGSLAFSFQDVDSGSGDNQWSASFSGLYGYFLTKSQQLAVSAILSDSESGDPAGAVYARYDFHFLTDKTVLPYVGGGVGSYFYQVTQFSGSTSAEVDFSYEVHGGIKAFLTESIFLKGELAYSITDVDPDEIKTASAFLGIGAIF